MSPTENLNAYRIVNSQAMTWSVAIYKIVPKDGKSTHDSRGKIKDIAWKLRNEYKNQCKGFGYIIDIDEETIAVPSSWTFPRIDDFQGYRIYPERVFQTNPNDLYDALIIKGILKESIKRQFKQSSDSLGNLWQDYNNFCQFPDEALTDEAGVIYCRGFLVVPEFLDKNTWALKVEVYTKSLDSLSLQDYYARGELEKLAEMIHAKRQNKLTRSNTAIDVSVWHEIEKGVSAELLTLSSPDDILKQAKLPIQEQKALTNQMVWCKQFNKDARQIAAQNIRLILDSQITQEDHAETIIEPSDRYKWASLLVSHFSGLDAYGINIQLAQNPLSIQEFDHIHVMPPAIRIRTAPNVIGTLTSQASGPVEDVLRERARKRANYIRQNGYLWQRPINPLLAFPKRLGERRALRMQNDLNGLLKNQGLEFKFGNPLLYQDVIEIQHVIEEQKYDTLFAVLPESQHFSQNGLDTHDKIKQQVSVPSQCIFQDNTLHPKWVDIDTKKFKEMDFKGARRIENRYYLCVLNLLVKHNWVPFAPAEPFTYNVHVGIDVGGQHNNRVMACIGYGFTNPSAGLVFLPGEINIETEQAEPIPTTHLFQGLLQLFDDLRDRLHEANIEADFSKILFFRDGQFRGKGNEWNEFEALQKLHIELEKRNLLKKDVLWTAVEVSKRAENWRLISEDCAVINNPLVGTCVFPFEDPQKAIVCTTGRPYLTQGTASPLLVKILDIDGQATRENVLRELIWEADLCFTKIDMGLSLPWVLHVADAGALQQSKAYNITGITV